MRLDQCQFFWWDPRIDPREPEYDPSYDPSLQGSFLCVEDYTEIKKYNTNIKKMVKKWYHSDTV